MIYERILIDAFTVGITDPVLDVVKANVMARPELVGGFDAVTKWYVDYIKKMPKARKISEVKTRDNRDYNGHQVDGGGKRRGGRSGRSWTGQGGGGNNHGQKLSCKDIDDCTHIKYQYLPKPVYKNYSAAKRANIYELRLVQLDKEGPQGDKKRYVRKIKSLQRQLGESRMGNDDSSDDEANLFNSSNVHFEEDNLDTKDNNNLVRQGGTWERNKNKKWEIESPNSDHVVATLYASVATVAIVRNMLLQ